MTAKGQVESVYFRELKQTGMRINKYRLDTNYMGVFNQSANYQTNEIPDEIPIEGLVDFHKYSGSAFNPAAIIVQPMQEPVYWKLHTYQNTNEVGATFFGYLSEDVTWVHNYTKRSDTSSATSSVIEELDELWSRQTEERVEVYPGYSVSQTEYDRRFKGVDLDHFRKLLSPELFKAYVHTMGLIEGWGIKPQDRFKGKD